MANCPTHGAFTQARHLHDGLRNGDEIYGFFLHGQLIGCFVLSALSPQVLELKKLAVLPAFRHRGYGETLVKHAIGIARARRSQTLRIGIIQEHQSLEQWYARLGFIHTHTETFAHLPFTVGYMEFPISI